MKLNFENATLRQVFKDLKQQTGFLFIYNEEELDRRAKVSLKEENITLKTALEKILFGLPYSFDLLDDMVVIDLLLFFGRLRIV